MVLLIVTSNAYAQTITKSNPPTVETPSTVGKIVKWAAAEPNGKGIIGDSVITESAGNILIGGDATANTINATTLNVSGNATVGGTLSGDIVNATTQYDIGGSHVLSSTFSNLFVGRFAGQNTTFGSDNNSFFGATAGRSNTTGRTNSFFGADAGVDNTTGSGNAFFGHESGIDNTTGSNNAFFCAEGANNSTGSSITLIGCFARVGVDGLTFATAIGANATVSTSNTVVLGTATETVKVPGNLDITGTLTKGGGMFKIDYPLDPANKTLSHSFVESPDMMNIYNGNVTTDAKGRVIVALPEYFETLNRDFRYQLTVMGQFAQAIVASEIKDNRFTIKTDKPNVKVSWQVTGIRQDAYANANRIQVVEDKGKQRGTYLHPELFTGRTTGSAPR